MRQPGAPELSAVGRAAGRTPARTSPQRIRRVRRARVPLALSLTVALAACGASGGGASGAGASGGGPGGSAGGAAAPSGLTAAEYRTLLDNYRVPGVAAAEPTSDMPVTGRGTYSGTVQVTLRAGTGGAELAELLEDAAVEVVFGRPGGVAAVTSGSGGGSVATRSAASPVTGTVDNLRGTRADGAPVRASVTFSTAHAVAQAAGGGVLRTEESTIDTGIAGLPTVTSRSGEIAVPLGATLTGANAGGLPARGAALLTLRGPMTGPAATASVGTAAMVIDDAGTPGPVDITGTGSYVIERR